eukprot:UN33443
MWNKCINLLYLCVSACGHLCYATLICSIFGIYFERVDINHVIYVCGCLFWVETCFKKRMEPPIFDNLKYKKSEAKVFPYSRNTMNILFLTIVSKLLVALERTISENSLVLVGNHFIVEFKSIGQSFPFSVYFSCCCVIRYGLILLRFVLPCFIPDDEEKAPVMMSPREDLSCKHRRSSSRKSFVLDDLYFIPPIAFSKFVLHCVDVLQGNKQIELKKNRLYCSNKGQDKLLTAILYHEPFVYAALLLVYSSENIVERVFYLCVFSQVYQTISSVSP